MSNNQLFGADPVNGRSKWTFVDHTGPSSYVTGGETLGQSVFGGPNVLGLSGWQWVSSGITNSQNYRVDAFYSGVGIQQKVFLRWAYSGNAGNGVTTVTGTGGSGMTAGTYALVFVNTGTGGSGAAGTITVTTSAITSINITNPGSGYTSAPTVSAATGGTPPTLTAQIGGVAGTQVAAGTNLSAETIRILAIGG